MTRDTHGIAIKCTAVASIKNSIESWHATYKDPKTDNSSKKSARGFLAVTKVNGHYKLTELPQPVRLAGCQLKTVVLNPANVYGIKSVSLSQIRTKLQEEAKDHV